jgi:hypothetical protein
LKWSMCKFFIGYSADLDGFGIVKMYFYMFLQNSKAHQMMSFVTQQRKIYIFAFLWGNIILFCGCKQQLEIFDLVYYKILAVWPGCEYVMKG